MTQPFIEPPLLFDDQWSVRASPEEQVQVLPGDELIAQPIDTLTHGITIRRPPRDVWAWLVQMGAGSRAGWYSYDWLDNGGRRSAERIEPAWQHPAVGSIFPALPGMTEGFVLLAVKEEKLLTLGMLGSDGRPEVTWGFVLREPVPGLTRLLVRARGGPGYRFHGLPLLLTRLVVRAVHFIMERKQLLEIKQRAELMPVRSTRAAHFPATNSNPRSSWPMPELPSTIAPTLCALSKPIHVR